MTISWSKKLCTLLRRIATESERNYLVSEPNYHNTKIFTKDLLEIEIRKTQILMNQPLYLGS